MLSVITATNRPERLQITKDCLDTQTFQDFEWIVVCPEKTSFGKWVADPPKKEGDVYALNKAMNAGIKASQGDLLIRIDDSIWFSADALAKFYAHYQFNPQACVSGVGDQYDQLDENGKPCHKVWIDPRKRSDLGTFYETNPEDWEANYASFPRSLIYEIGGWDEDMDQYYSWDNVAVAYRLSQVGARFYLDQTNESFSFQHGRPKDWSDKDWIHHDFHNYVNQRGLKLDYLS